jgi:ribosomal protein S6
MDTHTESDIAVYELSYHMTRMSEADCEKQLQTIRDAVIKAGGSFLAEGALEDMELAYSMSQHDKSMFGWMKFEIAPAAIQSLQHDVLKAQKNLIRYSLIKTVREDTRASAQARTPHVGTGVVQEVETKGVLERKTTTEEPAEAVSDEALDEALDELTDEK